MIRLDTISPSSLSTFEQCPQKFQFQKIDLWQAPPGYEALRGIIVHDALRRLYSERPQRTRTREAAQYFLGEALDEAFAANAEQLSDQDIRSLPSECLLLVNNYFEMENPDHVNPIGLELHLAMRFAGLRLHGYLDRLDLTDAGTVVVDYKTGKTPSRRYRGQALSQLFIYAYLVREVVGRAPEAVRLLYLRDRTEIVEAWNDTTHLRTSLAITDRLAALRAVVATDVYPAQPSILCGWCAYRPICPAHDGRA